MSSELPEIDPLKVAEKDILRLRTNLNASENRESQYAVLVEALRDQRDAAEAGRDEAIRQLTELRQEIAVRDVNTSQPTVIPGETV